jgi:hypothetical protein
MAGEMAEAISDGSAVLDYEALLISESADPIFSDYVFEYGSLEEVFNHATSVFGDHHRAACWLRRRFPPSTRTRTGSSSRTGRSSCAVHTNLIRRSGGARER